MRKIFKKVGVVIISAAMIVSSSAPSFAARKQFNIATGFIGSSMHAVGTVVAKHMQKKLRMRVTARPYVGPSAFLPLINNGELSMGLSSMSEANAAYNGVDTDPKKDVRTVARLFAMPFAFIVRKDSGIGHTVLAVSESISVQRCGIPFRAFSICRVRMLSC